EPILGYGIKGMIWYQGENNTRDPKAYQTLFPAMITMMREDWGQGDFPFYWVQLADFKFEKEEPGPDNWAELREAQTMVLDKLPNVGQAVIYDTGEVYSIHPKNKQVPAHRLARHALVKNYGLEMPCESPRFESMTIEGSKAVLDFKYVTKELHSFDSKVIEGFQIAGEDQKFVWAEAKAVDKDTIEVWSESIPHPVAVRYAWEINPKANVFDRGSLPLTPFRTDNWEH
ncbi:MAG: sialate O-acetylesterase, partial [Puniceicoccales bacterium]